MILQNADDLEIRAIDSAVGRRGALILAKMSPKERFESMGSLSYFKVRGLSSMLSKLRDFEKLMAILNVVKGFPILLQAFFKKYSESKVLEQMFKQMNLNPETIARNEKETQQMAGSLQDANMMNQLGMSGEGTQQGMGGASTEASINQTIQPTAGM